MRSFLQLLLLLCIFSILFFLLRFYGYILGYNVSTLVLDVGGLAYLYSTVGTMFSVFAAFIIVSEYQDWNKLSAATSGEVQSLNEVLLWSRKLKKDLSDRFSRAIQKYLTTAIDKEWPLLSTGEECPDIDAVLDELHDLVSETESENAEIASHIFVVLQDLLNRRSVRIEYSWQPLPIILKFTVFAITLALMGLSFLIGVNNMWLDYTFMLCIVSLGAMVLIVIDDLDNPLRPGQWCLTTNGHKRLLTRMEALGENNTSAK